MMTIGHSIMKSQCMFHMRQMEALIQEDVMIKIGYILAPKLMQKIEPEMIDIILALLMVEMQLIVAKLLVRLHWYPIPQLTVWVAIVEDAARHDCERLACATV